MTDPQLVTLARHARVMAAPGAHVPDCVSLKPVTVARIKAWDPGLGPLWPPCDGCVPENERWLWLQIADEIAAYMAGDLEDQTPGPDQIALELP